MNNRMFRTKFNEVVKPILADAGFLKSSSRGARRYKDSTIDVIEFQTFDSHIRDGVGCTPLSFSVRLGVHYRAIEKAPWLNKDEVKKSNDNPREFDCEIRGALLKDVDQSGLFRPWGEKSTKDRMDVWYVCEDGSNLEDMLFRASSMVKKFGLQWFDYFNNTSNLLNDSEGIQFDRIENTLQGEGSFAAAELYSSIALDLGLQDIAIEQWKKVIQNPYYNKPQSENWLKMAQKRIGIIQELNAEKSPYRKRGI